MSAHEFGEWLAYAQIEPFGQDHADLPSAIVAATIANVHRPTDREPYSPTDFLPSFEPHAQQTWETQLAFVEMLNAAFGGTDDRSIP